MSFTSSSASARTRAIYIGLLVRARLVLSYIGLIYTMLILATHVVMLLFRVHEETCHYYYIVHVYIVDNLKVL